MAAADGAACPMHAQGAVPLDCAMTGVCNAPGAALAAVLMQAAEPLTSFALLPRTAQTHVTARVDEQAHTLALTPDAPPPRL